MTPNLQPVVFRGRLAAAATENRFFLAPHIEVLEDDHPERLFVSVMCFHARDIIVGRAAQPYSDANAELAARRALIDEDDFRECWHLDDATLAERYVVPLEQISAKRIYLISAARQREGQV
jgi:hypothetical protein